MTALEVEPTDRAKSMAMNALRRLSTTEVEGLGIALEKLAVVEMHMISSLPQLRAAATKERALRAAKGLPPEGPFTMATREIYQLIHAVTEAIEQTNQATITGKVPRRKSSRRGPGDAAA